MSLGGYSKDEQEISDVLAYQAEKLSKAIEKSRHDSEETNEFLDAADEFLMSRGISAEEPPDTLPDKPGKRILVVPSWDTLVEEAGQTIGSGHQLEELFTHEELERQNEDIRRLHEEYAVLHRLDKVDIAIGAIAGIAAAAVDLLLVGIPHRTTDGLKAKPLGDYVRARFDRVFSTEEMAKLAKQAEAKVPYDAPYNAGFTDTFVEGLWPTMHRLYSLGHDPLLGLVVGVKDILNGEMTTIDKFGKVVVQGIDRYSGREECELFAALCKQILHFKTDVATSMGLPAPLMSVFNLFQFGSIGEENQTIAEIVQGMYYEGYDFIHFCSQSIPVMIAEVIVRLCYFGKRVHEGYSVRESIPFSTNRERHPKLGTLLFMAHSAAAAINAGKVYFTKNPMEINYPQWLAFTAYSFKQAKWSLLDKPEMQHRHTMDAIGNDLNTIIETKNAEFEELSGVYMVVYE